MEAVRTGDFHAFEILYERYHRAVFTFALRSLGDRGTAEDLLQETFLRVFARRPEYRPVAAFRTWLFTIARNLVVDQIRRRGAASYSDVDTALDVVIDPAASPLDRAEVRELSDRLERALSRLPATQREVLLLSRVAGLSHRHVAEVTGQTPGAVRVALHRALRELRSLLGLK